MSKYNDMEKNKKSQETKSVLEELRKEKNISRAKLAKTLEQAEKNKGPKICSKTIQRWEKENRSPRLSPSQWLAMSRLFKSQNLEEFMLKFE